MARKRKLHSAAFKAQVALAAIKGDKTVSELAAHFEVHPTLINDWKRRLLAGAESVFGAEIKPVVEEAEQGPLYEQIGRLKVELDWIKKKAAKLG